MSHCTKRYRSEEISPTIDRYWHPFAPSLTMHGLLKKSILQSHVKSRKITGNGQMPDFKLSYWGDLLRSVPFIMGGHLNMDFFQVVFAQVFDTNPKSICLMMIHKHSGRAPRPFQHLLLAMSALEMSGHDTKRLSWFF